MARLGGKKLLAVAGLILIAVPISVLSLQSKSPKSSSLAANTNLQTQSSTNNQLNMATNSSSNSSKQGTGNANGANSSSVTINGQTYQLGPNGQYHSVVKNGAGQTTLDVSVSNHSSGVTNNSTTSVNFSSTSETTVNGQSASN